MLSLSRRTHTLALFSGLLWGWGCSPQDSDSGSARVDPAGGVGGTDSFSETGQPEDSGEVEPRSPEQVFFDAECAGCHGADGDSGSAPNLSQMVPRLSDENLYRVIDEGSGTMPGGTVGEEDIPDFIVYLRERFP